MDVRLPKLGEGADSGSVVGLFVKEGDLVKKGQTILELENEKAVAPIPSPVEGIIKKIRVKEGDKISVGQVLLTLADESKSAANPALEKSEREETAQPAPEPERAPAPAADAAGEPFESKQSRLPPAASPSIRKLGRDLGIDLTRVKGSEAAGRIVLADLKAYIEHLQRRVFAAPAARESAAAGRAQLTPPPEQIDFSKWGPVRKVPLTTLRRTISQRLLESWNSIPHVTQFDEADVTSLVDLRKKFSGAYEKNGARLTVTSFLLRAIAATLKQHPIFNASLDEVAHEIVFKEYIHLGIAVDTEAGLLVPVLRDADKKSILEISKELPELAAKARERKLSLDEMKGGTFTISNQGGIGGAHFTPIIHKPEVAILGLGRSALKPVCRDGKIEPRSLLPLALSYDHRLMDGGQAARFISDLVQAIEKISEHDVKL